MSNMDIYERLATPPNDALKKIGFGNLKGKSDINPQWRYEALTNQFGPCGIGWKYTINNYWTQPVEQTGEVMIFVMISFFHKQGDAWSEPIPAYGGDFLIKRDKNGYHGNDEAMKMAVTDALGTAVKMIGVAADVYRGLIENGASDSKYARRDDIARQTAQTPAPPRPYQPAGIVKGGTDEMRQKAAKSLNEEVKRIGCTVEEVQAIAQAKYGKGTKEMTAGELAKLTNSLESFILESAGA